MSRGIRNVPSGIQRDLQLHLLGIKSALDELLGSGGQRAVRYDELQDLVRGAPTVSSGGNTDDTITEPPSDRPPGSPDELVVVGGRQIDLRWSSGFNLTYLGTEVWGRRVVNVWDNATTYKLGSLVLGPVPSTTIYKSLQANNLNHAVTDTDWWTPAMKSDGTTPLEVMAERVLLDTIAGTYYVFSSYEGELIGAETWAFWVRNLDENGLTSAYYPGDEIGISATSVLSSGFLIVDKLGFTLDSAQTADTGELCWNADEETLDLGLAGGSALQVGQETLYHVKNNSGSTAIANGTLCMYVGTDGASGKIKVAPWDGDAVTHPSKTILGLATSAIPGGGTGYVTHFGKVRGIQTNGANYGETWVDGDILYAGATGGLTKTLPAAPKSKTTVAVIINAHATNGTLFVRPTYGSQLGEDESVQLSGLANGDVLVYDGIDGRFENRTVTGAGIQPLDADLTAIAGLSGTSGLLKKTAANTWTLDTTDYGNMASELVNSSSFLASTNMTLRGGGVNLVTYSERMDNVAWTKTRSSITSNAVAAPDGTLTADKLVEDTSSGIHYASGMTVGFASYASGVTLSVFVKAAERSRFAIGYGAFTQTLCIFNLSNSTVSVTNTFGWPAAIGSINSVGNGWFRCSFYVSTGGIAYNAAIAFACVDNSGNISYTGDGASGIYIWGAQLVAGSVAGPYTKTETAAIASAGPALLSVPNGIILNTTVQGALTLSASGNFGVGTTTFGASAAAVFGIKTGTAPTTGPADTIQIYSTDLSAGNTILSLFTEGTPVNANTTAATTHRIAIRINGTIYYLLANTAA